MPDAQISDVLTDARIDLAAALRWADRVGLSEGICNHFSFALPGTDDRFLINPQGVHWSEITASSLLLVDAEGELIEGDAPPEPTAFFIHWRLHKHAPQAACVLHTHMPFATSLTSLEDGRLLPVNQNSLMFHDRVAYDDDYKGLALDAAEGDRMCAALGNRSILFLANHGVIVTGASVAEAFNDLYYLERACMTQVMAMSTGRPLKLIDEATARKTAQQIADNRTQPLAHFTALKRILDRQTPDYRD